MSKAKAKFDATLTRCAKLVEAAEPESSCSDELLRFAVVLGVAAFDTYMADLFSEPFVSFVKQTPDKKRVAKFLTDISFGAEEMLDLLCANKDRPFRTIHAAVDRHLEKQSFQSEKSIGKFFAIYRLPNLFSDSVKKAGGKRTENRVRNMILRRHEIAHACDLKSNGTPQNIDAKQVRIWMEALQRLTNAMEEIVERRFDKKRLSSREGDK